MIREGFKDGDKSKAICDTCGKVVDTTIRSADFFEDTTMYKGIQQGFCDVCGKAVSITHKGAVELNRQRKP